jgi:pimeloyl-ACP methyl ester carboxylesterase
MVRDLKAVVRALAPVEFDLGGFSLGARTAASGVIAGLRPRRLVLGGVGLESLSNWDARAAFFIDAIDRFDEIRMGDPAYFTVQFMKTMKIDRMAARLLLTQGVDDPPPGSLADITMPTLVVSGAQDRDNGSPEALVEALPDARYETVPGSHMSSVTEPALGEAIARFLSA